GIRAFHVTGVQTCALPICSLPSRYRLLKNVLDPQSRALILWASSTTTMSNSLASTASCSSALRDSWSSRATTSGPAGTTVGRLGDRKSGEEGSGGARGASG